MTITVRVKLFASLAKFGKENNDGSQFEVALKENASIEHLIQSLKIPVEKVRMISVNDKIVSSDAVLSHNDKVILFPTIAGG